MVPVAWVPQPLAGLAWMGANLAFLMWIIPASGVLLGELAGRRQGGSVGPW
jgi:hypothetical protein